MASEAHLRANKKYLQSMETFTIRVTPEQAAAIREHAQSRGLSVNACVLEAVNASMGGKLPPSRRDAQRAAQSLSGPSEGPMPGQTDLFSKNRK